MLLDYIFKLNIDCYNIADKAAGGCVGSKENHQKLCEASGGFKAKVRFALEVKQPEIIYTFETGVEAAKFTGVPQCNITHSCKDAKPYNSESGRWLF